MCVRVGTRTNPSLRIAPWRGVAMRATVNDECIGCGLCEGTAGAVFEVGDEGVAEVIIDDEVPEELEDDVQDAADNCPVGAIELE